MTKKLLLVALAAMVSTQAAHANDIQSIEAQIQEAQERTKISILKDEVNELRLKMQALEDIADSGLASAYRSNKSTIYLSAGTASMLGWAFTRSPQMGSGETPVYAHILAVVGLGLLLKGALSLEEQQTYNQLKETYSNLSGAEQSALYQEISQKIQTDLNAIDQALN